MPENNHLTEGKSYSLNDHTPIFAPGVWTAPGARIIGKVHLGEDVSVWYNCVLRGDVEKISIGDRTNIQDLTVIHADKGDPTIVGSDVTVGHAAILHGCIIGPRSLIGMGAKILNNADIGEESLVAAGSLVPPGKVYPPRSLIMGSPAKVVREITEEEVQDFLRSATHYVNNARLHASGLSVYTPPET